MNLAQALEINFEKRYTSKFSMKRPQQNRGGKLDFYNFCSYYTLINVLLMAQLGVGSRKLTSTNILSCLLYRVYLIRIFRDYFRYFINQEGKAVSYFAGATLNFEANKEF